MHECLSQNEISPCPEQEKSAIVTDWLRRSTADSRLDRHGHLPDRELVSSVGALVDFIVASIAADFVISHKQLATAGEGFARALWTQQASAAHVIIEFGHLRGSLQTGLSRLKGSENLAHLEAPLEGLYNALLAHAVGVFVEYQHAALAVQRAAIEDENSKGKYIVNVVGHELRSVLTPIITWIDMLVVQVKDGGPETTPYIVHAAMGLQRSTRSLKRLIDDLNEFAALSKGQLTIQFVPLDLRALLGDCLESFQPHAEKGQITLHGDIPERAVMVFADETRIQQCLLNLLNNTLKFTPSGGQVTVRLSIQEQKAQLEVADTGVGIKPELIHTIFEPFRQLESGRNAGGLGLGLAIVKTIVELHGGNVMAESEGPGRGTLFRISLPIYTGLTPSTRSP